MITWAIAWMVVQFVRIAAASQGDAEVKVKAEPGCLMMISIPADVAIFYLIYKMVVIYYG